MLLIMILLQALPLRMDQKPDM